MSRMSEYSLDEQLYGHPAEPEPSAVFAAGRDARWNGLPITDCPYEPGEQRTDWENGWKAEDTDRYIESLADRANKY